MNAPHRWPTPADIRLAVEAEIIDRQDEMPTAAKIWAKECLSEGLRKAIEKHEREFSNERAA